MENVAFAISEEAEVKDTDVSVTVLMSALAIRSDVPTATAEQKQWDSQ